MDNSVSFNRSMDDYENTFGDKEDGNNFWLGLEKIHQLTSRGVQRLRIQGITHDDEEFTLEYSRFAVGDKTSGYKLISSSGYSTNVDGLSNPLASVQQAKFTTRDRDNDRMPNQNCATDISSGGWWYSNCGYINLNGLYNPVCSRDLKNIHIQYLRDASSFKSKGIQSVEMRVQQYNERFNVLRD